MSVITKSVCRLTNTTHTHTHTYILDTNTSALHTDITQYRRLGQIRPSSWIIPVATPVLIQCDLMIHKKADVYEVRIGLPEEFDLCLAGRLMEDAESLATQLLHRLDDVRYLELALEAHLDPPRRDYGSLGEQDPTHRPIS